MPWLERPAGVYTRFEVVLHRIDEPYPITSTNSVTGKPVTYDCWEVRITYVFDAQAGRWEVQSARPFGYRRGVRNGPKLEIPSTTRDIRELAAHYAPEWIPDPSKPRTHLPAEDVWDESVSMLKASFEGQQMPSSVYRSIDFLTKNNPYRGE